MKKAKTFILKTYYTVICFLADHLNLRMLTRYKLILGALIISMTISSCRIFRPKRRTCHVVGPVRKESKTTLKEKTSAENTLK